MTEHKELAIFSPELKKFGELLLHHQCWFFGRDILHPDGNLLVQYGFKRYKAPKKTGTNRYRIVIGKSSRSICGASDCFMATQNWAEFLLEDTILARSFLRRETLGREYSSPKICRPA